MRRQRIGTACAALVVLAAACGEDAAGPAGALDPEDLADIAVTTDDAAAAIVFEEIGALGFTLGADPGDTRTRTFARTRECPAGGSISVEGSVERSRNDEGVLEFHAQAAGEWKECAHERRGITRIVSGEFNREATRRFQNGEHVGLQTAHAAGHFTWTRSDGKSGECSYDVTAVRDADAHTATITGTVCGREVHRERSWD